MFSCILISIDYIMMGDVFRVDLLITDKYFGLFIYEDRDFYIMVDGI